MYPAQMYLLSVKGSEIQKALARSVEDWTGQGHWLQVSGIAFEHDVEAGTVSNISILRNGTPEALKENASYKMVTIDYLVGKSGGDQDGYTMFNPSQIIEVESGGQLLKDIVFEALQRAGKQGISPTLDERIKTLGGGNVCANG